MVDSDIKDIVPTQFIKKDFNISDFINKDFLKRIEDSFNADATAINLTILLDNSENESKEVISFSHRNDKDEKNNTVIVDLSNPESFDKIKRIL